MFRCIVYEERTKAANSDGYKFYKRKKNTSESAVVIEQQVIKDDTLVLKTPVKPRTNKVYSRGFTKNHGSFDATDIIEHRSSGAISSCIDSVGCIELNRDDFKPSEPVGSGPEHRRDVEELNKVLDESLSNFLDSSGSIHLDNGVLVQVRDSLEETKTCNTENGGCAVGLELDKPVADEIDITIHGQTHSADPVAFYPATDNTQDQNESFSFPGDRGFLLMKKGPESGAAQCTKSPESVPTESGQPGLGEDSVGVSGGKTGVSLEKMPRQRTKKKTYRPRIMVEGKPKRIAKVSNIKTATSQKQNLSKKRKKEKKNEPEIIAGPETPRKQNLSQRAFEKKSKQDIIIGPATLNPIKSGKTVNETTVQEKPVSGDVVRCLMFDLGTQSREENHVVDPVHLNVTEDLVSKELATDELVVDENTDMVGVFELGHPNEGYGKAADVMRSSERELKRRSRNQRCYAVLNKRVLLRSKCLSISRNLGPNFPDRYKRKAMLRRKKADMSVLTFQIQLDFPEVIPSSFTKKGKRSKTITLFEYNRKKRSKRFPRLNISKLAAVPVCNQPLERIFPLLNQKQFERTPKMASDVHQGIPISEDKEIPFLSADEIQLPYCSGILTKHSFANTENQNGEIEGKRFSLFGESKGVDIVHKLGRFSDSVYTENTERWNETKPFISSFGFHSDCNKKPSTGNEYAANLEQHYLIQNVEQESLLGLEYHQSVPNVEHNILYGLRDHQLAQKDFWLVDKGIPQEQKNGAGKLSAAGVLYENQFPASFNLYSGEIPMHHDASEVFRDPLPMRLSMFSGEIPMQHEDTPNGSFIRSGCHLPPLPILGFFNHGLHCGNKTEVELIIEKMRTSDINERMLDFDTSGAHLKPKRKQGRKKQKDLDSERQLMVLNHMAQGPNSLVPHEKPSKRKMKTAKVDLDPDTIREWQLLMTGVKVGENADKAREKKWEGERELFRNRVDLFIKRMHLLQADRKFKPWKGSVVDSVVGVFLTQNVSDNLSSFAYMSLAAKFPPKSTENHENSQELVENYTRHGSSLFNLEGVRYFIDEPLEEDSVLEASELVPEEEESSLVEGCGLVNTTLLEEIPSDGITIHSCHEDGNNGHETSKEEPQDPLNIRSVSLEGQTIEKQSVEEPKPNLRKNKKTGVMEEEKVNWKEMRKTCTKEGPPEQNHMDSVDWDAVRLANLSEVAKAIIDRGQHVQIAGRIQKFLNGEVQENQTINLEWLRHVPPDLVKRYLLEINGLGLKSVECIRLLALKHVAFPVDTNVARIAVRLGWVPLEPLPEGVQIHLLDQYPLMDSIQKYLWPRLCILGQAILYELHYQLITFGKVFCTKRSPNCNACPMKAECRHFASAYASKRLALTGSQDNTKEKSETSFVPANSVVETNNTFFVTHMEEDSSPESGNQTNCCEPIVEMPPSPAPEVPELLDIEETPFRVGSEIPNIDMDMEIFRRNVQDAMQKIKRVFHNDDDVSNALVPLTPEKACIPLPAPRVKYYSKLRTEHVVYVLPDDHELLRGFERREPDDPSPYLLAKWLPGETPCSSEPPTKRCNSEGSGLCNDQTCASCCSIREENQNIFRGTVLIPCRTAMRGRFPLNGTYFQINEVFADHETSFDPITFPRDWIDHLETRALYCGSSVSAIFRGLDTRRIQLCFWTGYICVRGFDRRKRMPKETSYRLHTPPSKKGKKFVNKDDDGAKVDPESS